MKYLNRSYCRKWLQVSKSYRSCASSFRRKNSSPYLALKVPYKTVHYVFKKCFYNGNIISFHVYMPVFLLVYSCSSITCRSSNRHANRDKYKGAVTRCDFSSNFPM